MCNIEQNKDQVQEELKEQVEQEEQQEQEIEPLDSFDSHKLMGRILIGVILPTPL